MRGQKEKRLELISWGSTPLYGLYQDMLLDRVYFFYLSVLDRVYISRESVLHREYIFIKSVF